MRARGMQSRDAMQRRGSSEVRQNAGCQAGAKRARANYCDHRRDAALVMLARKSVGRARGGQRRTRIPTRGSAHGMQRRQIYYYHGIAYTKMKDGRPLLQGKSLHRGPRLLFHSTQYSIFYGRARWKG